MKGPWGDVQTAGPSASWAQPPENGWGAPIGWSAGPGNLGRRPSSDAGMAVTGYIDMLAGG